MRLARVVEVDDKELGLHLIGIEVCQEMVVGDLREVWELVFFVVLRDTVPIPAQTEKILNSYV